MDFKRLVAGVCIRGLIMVMILILLSFAQPIITNDIAMGQMQNSDEAFVIMDTYNKFKQFTDVIKIVVVGWYIGSSARDVFKFIEK